MLMFVILRHEMPPHDGRSSHWDLMLETGAQEKLLTWALEQLPADTPSVAAQLADHRRDYLTYEGPISGGRGHVQRWDTGTCAWLERSAGQWRVALEGQRLRGILTLRPMQDQPDRWWCRLAQRVESRE